MTRTLPLWMVCCAACGGGEIFVTPTTLDWGDIDFQSERPSDGYSAIDIVLRNDGKRTLTPEITGFDDFHLILGAPLLGEPLESGQQMIISVGVGAYDVAGGERDTEVSGTFSVDADALREPVPVSWAFVPVRIIPVDTGAF